MNRNKPSFSVKSTHRYVNNEPMPVIEEDKEYDFETSSKGITDTESNRRKGSKQGMAIRTADTSFEDYL